MRCIVPAASCRFACTRLRSAFVRARLPRCTRWTLRAAELRASWCRLLPTFTRPQRPRATRCTSSAAAWRLGSTCRSRCPLPRAAGGEICLLGATRPRAVEAPSRFKEKESVPCAFFVTEPFLSKRGCSDLRHSMGSALAATSTSTRPRKSSPTAS